MVIAKKIRNIFGTVVIASSVLMVAGFSSAESIGDSLVVKSTEYRDNEGNKFVALGIQQNNALINSLGDAESLKPDEQQKDLDIISNWLKVNNIENGGVYAENGKTVVQLTDNSPTLVTKLKTLVTSPDSVTVNAVKQNEKKLKSFLTSLSKIPEVTASAINTKLNKIDVYISETSYKKLKNEIVASVPEESINWIFGEFKVIEYASSNPGTTINDGSSYCTAGFNAKVGTTNVLLSAAHCGLGNYWYAGTGTSSSSVNIQ